MEPQLRKWVPMLVALAAILAGCSFSFQPGVSLSLPSNKIFTSVPIGIPYRFTSTQSSESCTWILYKLQGNGQYVKLADRNRVMDSSGTIVVDPSTIPSNDSTDGHYQLGFTVGSLAAGTPAASALTTSVEFTVQTGPFIDSVWPPIFNVTKGTQTVTISGWDFDAGTTLTQPASSAVVPGTFTITSAASASVQINFGSLNLADGTFPLQLSTGAGALTQTVQVPIVSTTGAAISLQPNGAGAGSYDNNISILITGTYFTPYTRISFLDGSLRPVPFHVEQAAFSTAASATSWVLIGADLSNVASKTTGTISMSNQDSTGAPSVASAPFSFY